MPGSGWLEKRIKTKNRNAKQTKTKNLKQQQQNKQIKIGKTHKYQKENKIELFDKLQGISKV